MEGAEGSSAGREGVSAGRGGVSAAAWLLLALLAALVFSVGYDQGLLLRPLLGKAGAAANHLHELFHDGRHLLGFPCH
ncbi:MAG: CbtB domain-containing protein [bacterium]